MLKVLGRANSSNVRKVLWTLDELGTAYEREDWGHGFRDARSPEFLNLNPNGQVPTIVDDGFVLWESNAIMRYLVEKENDRSLLSGDLRERALAEQWLAWQASELNPAWGYAVMALFRRAPGYDDPVRVQASIDHWGREMRILDAQLARTGAYAAGDNFSLADIALGISVHRWFAIKFDKPELASVQRYYDLLRERPAGAKYMHASTP